MRFCSQAIISSVTRLVLESYHLTEAPLNILLKNSNCLEWDAITPVVRLERIAPLDRTTSLYLSSCLMRCRQVMYFTSFHSNVSHSPLEPIAQLNYSYHLILRFYDFNRWWVLDMCVYWANENAASARGWGWVNAKIVAFSVLFS